MLAFSSLSETAMRLDFQQRADIAYRDRIVAHDDAPGFTKYLKGLQKHSGGLGGKQADGDDLVSDLTQMGAMK